MNKILSLIKTDLNITFGLSSILYSFKAKKNRWQSVIFAIAMLSLIPSYFMLVKALIFLFDSFRQLGQQSYFLLMGFLASQMMVFLFGLLYVMSKYYFSNDLGHLVPLPIKPSYILTSKFVTIMASEYITSLPIFLPFVFIYGIKGGEGPLYWLYALIAAIILPVLPLVISSILIMIMMKYTNVKGKKDMLRTIVSVVFLITIIFVQLQIQKIAQNSLGEDFLFNLARDANLLVKKLGIAFPPSMWGALALSNYDKLIGLTNLLIFIISSITAFIIMIFLSENLFFDGLIGNIEVSASKGRGKKRNLEKTSTVSKPYLAIARKELKMLFKTPIYMINSVGGVIIGPLVLVMTAVTGDESMGPLREFLYGNMKIVSLGAIGMIGALAMLNSVGSTTFSREGKNFWIQRTLPIKAEDQIFGRILASLTIQLIGIIVLMGSLYFVIKLDFITMITISVIGLLASIPMTQIGMIIDILRPMLTWTNPQQAMKQNLNVLIGMGVGVIYAGVLFLLVKLMIDKVEVKIIHLILTVIFIVSSVIFYGILKKLITKQFRDLE